MAKSLTTLAIILIAVVICVARMFIAPTHVSAGGSYQAVAHLFVGGLIGAWLLSRPTTTLFHDLEKDFRDRFKQSPNMPSWAGMQAEKSKATGKRLLFIAVAMSVVEIAAAVITRM